MTARATARRPDNASAAVTTPGRMRAPRRGIAICFATLTSACAGAPGNRAVTAPRPSVPVVADAAPTGPGNDMALPHVSDAPLDQAPALALVGWGRRQLGVRLRQTYACKIEGPPFLCGGSRVVALRDGAFRPSPEFETGLPLDADGTPRGMVSAMHGRWPDDAWLVADETNDNAQPREVEVLYHWQGATWRRVDRFERPSVATLHTSYFGSGVYWSGTLFIDRYCGFALCDARAYGGRARLPLRFAPRAGRRAEHDEELGTLPSGELVFHSSTVATDGVAPTWSIDLWAPDGRHEHIASNDRLRASATGDCEPRRVVPTGLGRRLHIGRVRGADEAQRRPCIIEQEGATFARLPMPDVAAAALQIERDREGAWWVTLAPTAGNEVTVSLWHRPPGGSWAPAQLPQPAGLPPAEPLTIVRLSRNASGDVLVVTELEGGKHDFAPIADLVYRPGPSPGPPQPFDW